MILRKQKLGIEMESNLTGSQGHAVLHYSKLHRNKTVMLRFRRISSCLVALTLAAFQIVPTFAAINNTVTASGTGPGGVAVTGNAGATVTVIKDAPALQVVKTITAPNPKANTGDILTYTFTVTNSGNVTLNNVGVSDANDGVGAPIVVNAPTLTSPPGKSTDTNLADKKWDVLAPGDVITFTASYTVVVGDISNAGSGSGTSAQGLPEPDGYLDDKVTASGDYNNVAKGTITTATATDQKSIQLNIAPALLVTKVADKTSNVKVGDLITYTYTVKNNGNATIKTVKLADTHNGTLNALTPSFVSFNVGATSTHTLNVIDLLQPGDTATYTATYTVTQTDIDTRQGP